jgi:hypothetical protein
MILELAMVQHAVAPARMRELPIVDKGGVQRSATCLKIPAGSLALLHPVHKIFVIILLLHLRAHFPGAAIH